MPNITKTILLILFAVPILVSGQDEQTVKGEIRGMGVQKIYLTKYFGDRITPFDSVMADSSGRFLFRIRPDSPVGLYRLILGRDQFIDLILNHEDIDLVTPALNPADSVLFLSSVENRIYHYYNRLDRALQNKMELLIPVLDFYPSRDRFYEEAAAEFGKIQGDLQHAWDSLRREHPETYAIRMIGLSRVPVLSPHLLKDDRIRYLKQHFFDSVNFQDTLLLNSNAWTEKAISYLSLYSNNRLPQKQLESEFIKATTALLNAAAVNPEVFKFLLDYLVGGFDKYHFDDVLTYIAENFQDPLACEDQSRKTTLQKKLDNLKKIAVGKTAPDIVLPDPKGKPVSLSLLAGDFILVVFWSSECGHCTEMLPRVKEVYDRQKQKKFEVFAVSLDTSRTEWMKFIQEQKLRWINVSDLKGFSSPPADEYNIYATPTMLLLGRERKILAKPVSYRELEQVLRENNLL
jgi:peroxiredoxin